MFTKTKPADTGHAELKPKNEEPEKGPGEGVDTRGMVLSKGKNNRFCDSQLASSEPLLSVILKSITEPGHLIKIVSNGAPTGTKGAAKPSVGRTPLILRNKDGECHMEVCFVARLNQRECVGRMIKCARQDPERRKQLCKSAPVLSLLRFDTPPQLGAKSAQTDCDTRRYSNKNPALDLIPDLCHVLAGPLEHGCATKQHDTGARALVCAIVELHDALQRFVVGSVQRKLSASTMLMFSRGSSHASSLSDLAGIDLGTAS